MAKFRKGDKVVRTRMFNDHDLGFMQQGSTYTVKDVDYMGMIAVEYDPLNRHFDDNNFERVEEPAVEKPIVGEPALKNMKDMFTNMKFRVNSPEHSKQIQEHLFTLGYLWVSESHAVVEKTDKPFLYANEDGRIKCGTLEYTFKDPLHKEYTLQEITSYTLVEKKETITIDGKEYYKEDVLKRLAELNSLN